MNRKVMQYARETKGWKHERKIKNKAIKIHRKFIKVTKILK